MIIIIIIMIIVIIYIYIYIYRRSASFQSIQWRKDAATFRDGRRPGSATGFLKY